jgi:hypothetical protein
VHLGGDGYVLRVVDGALAELARGDAGGRADAMLSGDRERVVAVLDGDDPLADAVAAGRVTVSGDPTVVDRLLRAVGRPPSLAA